MIFYDRNALPIDREQWAALLEDDTYRHVRYTEIISTVDLWSRCGVSTVWFGIDSSAGLLPMPLIFETMTFTTDPISEWDRYLERYPTLTHAQAGHVRLVTSVAATVLSPRLVDREPADLFGGQR
ncbi:MAG TPA: hypothetical protein VFW65_31845 [Pseudonocardiaceae bacterium]|nr:hypothetical protein [Pseudonocardiaceae bacterium]